MFHVPCGFVDLIFIPLNIYSVWLINNKMLLHVYRMRYDYSRGYMFDSTQYPQDIYILHNEKDATCVASTCNRVITSENV